MMFGLQIDVYVGYLVLGSLFLFRFYIYYLWLVS